MKTKSGRKRSTGARHPSGKLVQVHVPAPAAVRRAVGAAMAGAADASLATQLGWLRLTGQISDKQMAAGLGFARLFDAYAIASGLPRRTPPAQSIELRSPGRTEREIDAATLQAMRDRYRHVADLLQSGGCLGVVVEVCVDDRVPEWSRKAALIRGLDCLVAHFRL